MTDTTESPTPPQGPHPQSLSLDKEREAPSPHVEEEVLDFAVKLAREAGAIMLRHFSLDLAHETKADNSPVTVADKEINQLVVDAIRKAYPDHGIVSEELAEVQAKSPYVWLCDPIDGTVPYSMAVPIATFSLALCKDGVPIAAVVYDPFTKRMYTSVKGEGAWLNGERKLQVNTAPLRKSITGVTYPRELFGVLVDECKTMNPIFWSTFYVAMQVALGNMTAMVHKGNHPWDAAATKLIVEEAGGKVTDLFGNDQRYDQPTRGLLATNGVVHDELLALIRQYAVS